MLRLVWRVVQLFFVIAIVVRQDREKAANLRKLFEQHWLHCRHLESERAWFMNAYAVVVGGISAFIIGRGLQDLETLRQLETTSAFQFLFGFLVGLTLLGFFLTIRWIHSFEYHRKMVSKLALILRDQSGAKARTQLDQSMEVPPMAIPLPACLKSVRGVFRMRYWFPALYFVVLMLFAFVFDHPLKWWAFGCWLIALLLGVGYVRSLRRLK